jgi:hypothetical protein
MVATTVPRVPEAAEAVRTARQVPAAGILLEVAVTPQEAADIPVVEVTTRLCQQGVNEVKVRGEKGVLNGTPLFLRRWVGPADQRGGGRGTEAKTIESAGSKTVMVVQRLSGWSHSIVTLKLTTPSAGEMLFTVNLAAPQMRSGAALEIGGCPSLAVITTIELCLI